MSPSHALTAVLMLAGGGVGVIVAHHQGITSWPDAKLYLVVGVVTGAVAAFLFARVRK